MRRTTRARSPSRISSLHSKSSAIGSFLSHYPSLPLVLIPCHFRRPSDEAIAVLLEKLDVDHDQFVPLSDIINLAEGEGLGIVIGEDDVVVSEIVEKVKEVARPWDMPKPVAPVVEEAEVKKKLKKEDIVEG